MTESPPRAPARIEPRTDTRPRVRALRPKPSRAGNSSGSSERREAWILVGDVERALLQAGMLEVLIGVLPEPTRIYSSGIAISNALLALSCDRNEITRGWETLRSGRFLVPAGLMRVPTLDRSTALASRVASILLETIVKGGLPPRQAALRAITANGFESPAAPSGELRTARLRETVSRDDSAPSTLATTIAFAAGEGVERIYVFGLDPRLRGHPLVTASMSALSGTAPQLEFLAANPGTAPGALSYLFPGSGGPDRLIRDGRLAAQAWLETTGDAQRIFNRRPASV